MKYKQGDVIDTSVYGFLTVQAPITIQPNTNSKCDKLGGRTLYWTQDLESKDILLWDSELKNILTEEENLSSSESSDEMDSLTIGPDFEW